MKETEMADRSRTNIARGDVLSIGEEKEIRVSLSSSHVFVPRTTGRLREAPEGEHVEALARLDLRALWRRLTPVVNLERGGGAPSEVSMVLSNVEAVLKHPRGGRLLILSQYRSGEDRTQRDDRAMGIMVKSGASLHRPVQLRDINGVVRVVWRDEHEGDEYIMWGSANS